MASLLRLRACVAASTTRGVPCVTGTSHVISSTRLRRMVSSFRVPSTIRRAVALRAAAACTGGATPRRGMSDTTSNVPSSEAEDGTWATSQRAVRNIAVIAHVDHGKTSLVNAVVRSCDDSFTTDDSLDSNELEKERGITILAKCTSVAYKEHIVNIVDTPGHADFGGEVERVLNMCDGVVLCVCALEGPMPQTRYVLSKALAKGLKPIVLFNKCDREGARIGVVENEIFDLFVSLNATDAQLDFPIIYASAREGWMTHEQTVAAAAGDKSSPAAAASVSSRAPMTLMLDDIIKHISAPKLLGDATAPFRMLVSQMDYDNYIGKLLIGRIVSGSVAPGDALVALSREGVRMEENKVTKLFTRRGARTLTLDRAVAGDIVQLAGLASPLPTCTLAVAGSTRPLFADPIDPPTISMAFGVNDSPLAGREGSKLTSSMLAERLAREAASNVALSVLPSAALEGMSDATEVHGRGELQLAILIENMRREGFEMSVSPPAVLFKKDAETGEQLEPYEEVVIDVDEVHSGMVIERMASRKAELREFVPAAAGRGGKARLNFRAPSRGLIGFQSELKTESRGSATMHRLFDSYGAYIRGLDRKPRAVMVSNGTGSITAYALDALQARGTLFVGPGMPTYEGHIVGECSRDSLYDMEVNVVKAKKLTNIRAAGSDDMIRLPPPKLFTLEDAIVYVAADELVEVTPTVLRLRKRVRDAGDREKASRSFAKAMKMGA